MHAPRTPRPPASPGTTPLRARLALRALTLLACAALLSAAPAPAAAVPFDDGDLYLLSRSLPTIGQGILRVDPGGGGTSVLVDLPDLEPVYATLSYDAYRDRLLFSKSTAPAVQTVDASGATASIPTGGEYPTLVAARGDGIVYLWIESALEFRYLDGSGTVHDLLDAGGSSAFALPVGTQLQEMIYDPGTNSLVCLSSNAFAPCATVGWTCAVRVPLTPAGTQVSGAQLSTEVDVSTVSPEDVDGASLMPGGSILVIVDTNDNLAQPRIQVLDPAAMSFSTFATNGPYTGAAATDAGTWSTVQNGVLILDSLNDVLRRFGSGESGAGTVFATGVSGGGGSAEDARLIQVVRPTGAPAARAGGAGLLMAALAALAAKRRRRMARAAARR